MAQGSVGVNILSEIVQIGGSNVSAFGDIITVNPDPQVQLDFVFGINDQTGFSTVANSATVDVDANRLRLQTGVDPAGGAHFRSLRIAKYRPGEGMLARFTGAWTSSAADSHQYIGAGSEQDGYFFGYRNTDFGVCLRKGGVDTFVLQADWNVDKCNGTGPSGFTWNHALGNVMMITYPYLGYGNIFFWVQNPVNGVWILCHVKRYANSSALVQIDNPSLRFYCEAVNTGNTTNLISYVGSAGIFVTGKVEYLGAQFGQIGSKNGVSTEANVISLRNATSYNGKANTGVMRIRSISFCSDGTNNPSLMFVKKDVTLGGSPSFTAISGTTADQGVTITSGQSIASFDTAGTTITGGTQLFNTCCARNGDVFIDMAPYDVLIEPGETFTFSASAPGSTDMRIAVNWNEDV